MSSFFKHLIWNRLSAAISTIVAIVVIYKGKSSLVLSIAFIHWCNYLVIYILSTYFILSNVLLNTVSTGFVYITAKKGGFQYLFIWFYWFYFTKNTKSLFESYWPFIYIIHHFLFQTYDLKLALFCHCNNFSIQLYLENCWHHWIFCVTIKKNQLIHTKDRDKQISLRYNVFCETFWGISGKHIISCFILSWFSQQSYPIGVIVIPRLWT